MDLSVSNLKFINSSPSSEVNINEIIDTRLPSALTTCQDRIGDCSRGFTRLDQHKDCDCELQSNSNPKLQEVEITLQQKNRIDIITNNEYLNHYDESSIRNSEGLDSNSHESKTAHDLHTTEKINCDKYSSINNENLRGCDDEHNNQGTLFRVPSATLKLKENSMDRLKYSDLCLDFDHGPVPLGKDQAPVNESMTNLNDCTGNGISALKHVLRQQQQQQQQQQIQSSLEISDSLLEKSLGLSRSEQNQNLATIEFREANLNLLDLVNIAGGSPLKDKIKEDKKFNLKLRSGKSNSTGQRSSIYRGVTRHRWTGRYEAHLWDNSCRKLGQNKKGRQVYLGGYDIEEDAARAYDLAALKYWGPGTLINFPLSNYAKELEEMHHTSRQEYIASLRRKSSGFARGASKFRGVTRHHQHGRWEARIGRVLGNKYLYLGTYSTQEEAAEAYDIAAVKYRGLNAVTNFELSRYITGLKSPADIETAAAKTRLESQNLTKHIFNNSNSPAMDSKCMQNNFGESKHSEFQRLMLSSMSNMQSASSFNPWKFPALSVVDYCHPLSQSLSHYNNVDSNPSMENYLPADSQDLVTESQPLFNFMQGEGNSSTDNEVCFFHNGCPVSLNSTLQTSIKNDTVNDVTNHNPMQHLPMFAVWNEQNN